MKTSTPHSNIRYWVYQTVKMTCLLVFFFLKYLLSSESTYRMRRTSPLTQYQTQCISALCLHFYLKLQSDTTRKLK